MKIKIDCEEDIDTDMQLAIFRNIGGGSAAIDLPNGLSIELTLHEQTVLSQKLDDYIKRTRRPR
ncbi:MAG: hypothetical protein ACYDHY_06465 [Acidiferrobacterales bacterium]